MSGGAGAPSGGGGFGSGGGGGGGPPGPPPPPGIGMSTSPYFGEPNRDRNGRWMLYDEKIHIDGTLRYDAKKPSTWLQDVKDYDSGRTRELDQLLQWIESQTEEISIDRARDEYPGCFDCAPIIEVARQMWSFVGPLIREDADKA